MRKCYTLLVFLMIALCVKADIKLKAPTVADAEDMLHVTLSSTDQNGTELQTSNLFFVVYRDNAEAPFEFTTSEFAYISENMTEVPYNYQDSNSYDIWSDGNGKVTIYHPGSWSGFSKLGAQAIYHEGDKTYRSDIVWSDGSTNQGDNTGGNKDDDQNTELDETQLISNPTGERVNTVRTSVVFYRLGSAKTYSGDDTGAATNYVKGEDGNIYLSCVMGGNDTGNYLRLEPSATKTKGKYVAKLPQLVLVEEYDGKKYGYYANRMQKEYIAENPDSINYLFSDAVPNELTYTLHADGSLTLDESNQETIMGLTYSDSVWTGFGDATSVDSPVGDKIVRLPENADVKTFVFAYEWANYADFGRMEKYVKGAIVGDELYINNPYNKEPDQWFKGTILGDSVYFDCGQIMGIDKEYNRYLYLRGGNLTKTTQGYYTYADAQRLAFGWDNENKAFARNDKQSIYVSRGYGRRGFNTNYDFPSLSLFADKFVGLKNPEWTWFCEDDWFDTYGYSYVQITIPKVDAEGNELNTDSLYYCIYRGDSQTPFVFDATTYSSDLTDDMTEIPFNMDANCFWMYSPGSEIHSFMAFFDICKEKVGVQSIYYDSEGVRHTSDIIYHEPTSDGISIVRKDSDRASVYYNLQGQRVNHPQHGLYIHNGKKILVK